MDYVCTIRYSESEGEFQFLALRYANPTLSRAKPENGMALYFRILKEFELRATLIETLLPKSQIEVAQLREKAIAERGSTYGYWFGFAAFCLLGFCLYRLTWFLSRNLGNDWAEIIAYIPAFFVFAVVLPVQHLIEGWSPRRYCTQHSHRIETYNDQQEQQITWCKRCGLHIRSSDLAGDALPTELVRPRQRLRTPSR